MRKIFRVGIKYTFDFYKTRILFEDKLLKKDVVEEDDFRPILARDYSEAIDKYKKIYYKEQSPVVSPWERKAKNIKRKIVCYKYKHCSFRYLWESLHYEDFILYCKENLGIEANRRDE